MPQDEIIRRPVQSAPRGAHEPEAGPNDTIGLHERRLADRVQALGADHPDSLASRSDLADAYRTAGRLGEAIRLHEQTLADRTRVLGQDHRDTLGSKSKSRLPSAWRGE